VAAACTQAGFITGFSSGVMRHLQYHLNKKPSALVPS
jgi:hypothetical protein